MLMQDENSGKDGRRYNEWLANRPDSRRIARQAAKEIEMSHYSCKRCGLRYDDCKCGGPHTAPKVPPKVLQVPTPLPDAEKRLQALLGALLEACEEEDRDALGCMDPPSLSPDYIRKIIKENT